MSHEVKKRHNPVLRKLTIAGLIVSALSFSGQSVASNCKGLENTACGANTSCSWVGSYERKDGRKVNAFCRAKPAGKKSSASKLGGSQNKSANVKASLSK